MIHGNNSNTTTLYDPSGPSVTSGDSAIESIGAGGHSFMITSGAYQNHRVVVCGSGSSSLSTVHFDPTFLELFHFFSHLGQ